MTNPNYAGPVKDEVLLAREVLLEEFANHGMVTEAIEEHLAANWERSNKLALMRTWEERAYLQTPDDSEECHRCGVPHEVREANRSGKLETRRVEKWKKRGAPHAKAEAQPYFDRRTYYTTIRDVPKSIDMDPAIAMERIELLMRSSNPGEHEREINELRTQVLGEDAIAYSALAGANAAPVTTQVDEQAADETVRTAPVMTEIDAKLANFYTMDWREQKSVVERETDVEFLALVRSSPAKRVIPAVKTAAKKRMEALAA